MNTLDAYKVYMKNRYRVIEQQLNQNFYISNSVVEIKIDHQVEELKEEVKATKKKKSKRKKYTITKDLKELALQRDGYRCAECGMISNIEIHHIEHRANGGNNDLDNLITLCVYCHYEQHKHQPIGRLMLSNMMSKGLIKSE